MTRGPGTLVAAIALLAGCDDTTIDFVLDFDGSISPAAIGEIVQVVEPTDGSGLAGTPAEGRSDVRWRLSDADADGALDAVFWITEEDVHFRGGEVLGKHTSPPTLPVGEMLTFTGIVANREGVQIGVANVTTHFVLDEERVVKLPIRCLCEGGLGCWPGNSTVCPVIPQEICGDEVDDDGDGRTDCADPDCHDRPGCEDCHAEVCDTLDVDESCDGLPGCDDPDCAQSDFCRGCTPEACDGHGVDEDCDRLADCVDYDCVDSPTCQCDPPDPVETCDNGIDDDCDGRMDRMDCECPGHPVAEFSCDNGVDDDCDGELDCVDDDCASEPGCYCTEREICGAGGDDDCDGLFDCFDEDDCVFGVGIVEDTPETCSDRADNDVNCYADCADDNCKAAGAAGRLREICGNGRDDDCDFAGDCSDPDCSGPETFCHDRWDDDCDLLVDCSDPDCADQCENCDVVGDEDGDGFADCFDPECQDDPDCQTG